MLVRKNYNLLNKFNIFFPVSIIFILLTLNNLYACPGGHGDCDVAYRCDETYKLSNNWCYPTDAVMTCDTSVSPPKCNCECPPGGCSNCAQPLDPLTDDSDCAKAMIIIDKIFDYSGLGSLQASVDMHYERKGYASSCGNKNFKHNFFTIRVFYPCGTEGSFPNIRIKWCDTLFPSEKKDGYKKTSSFPVRKSGRDFLANKIGVNNYYAARPKADSVEYDGGKYQLLTMHFSEKLKMDPYNIGEFDENYFNSPGDCSTNLGSEYCVWRKLKFCEEYNTPSNDDTDFEGDHERIVGDIWTAVGLMGATTFGGPAAFLLAPLVLLPAMETDLLRKQETLDKDRKCYNSKLFYYLLWENYKEIMIGNVPTCDETDRPGYCKTEANVAKSGITIPISAAMPLYLHEFSRYKGGSYKINTPPAISYTLDPEFAFFNPKVNVAFSSGGVTTNKDMIANSSFIHDHDAAYGYHLRFQIEDSDSLLKTPKLCLYSCRKANDSPANCTDEQSSLFDLIVTETNISDRESNKAKYLVPFTDSETCVPYPELDAAKGDKIVLTALYQDANGFTSYDRPIANVKLYNNATLIGSYDLKLYEEIANEPCDIYGTTDLRKRVNRECQLGAIFHDEVDYVNHPQLSFNNSDFMYFYLFRNSDLIDYDQDNTRYQAYMDSRGVINQTSLESDIQTIVDYYDDSHESADDNTPDHYCSLYHLDSDVSASYCQKYDGQRITCNYDSCGGGAEASLKASQDFRDLLCIHGLKKEKKTHSGNVGYYQLQTDGSYQLAYNIDATSTFDILPYDTDDQTGLIENDYYNYANARGIQAKNNLCFPLPYPAPQISFHWSDQDPVNPIGSLRFTNIIHNSHAGITLNFPEERDYVYDFYNKYKIETTNDNGIVSITVYRYNMPTDSTPDSTPVFTLRETLNTCPETTSLIYGLTIAAQKSQLNANGGYKKLAITAPKCDPDDSRDMIIYCDSYGIWSKDDPNYTCQGSCLARITEEYTLNAHMNPDDKPYLVDSPGASSCNEGYTSNGLVAVTATCGTDGEWKDISHNCEEILCTASGSYDLGNWNYKKLTNMRSRSGSPNCNGPDDVSYEEETVMLRHRFSFPVTFEPKQTITIPCNQLQQKDLSPYASWQTASWFSSSNHATFTCNNDGTITTTHNCQQKCYAINPLSPGWKNPGFAAQGRTNAISISGCTGGKHERHCEGTCQPNGMWQWIHPTSGAVQDGGEVATGC